MPPGRRLVGLDFLLPFAVTEELTIRKPLFIRFSSDKRLLRVTVSCCGAAPWREGRLQRFPCCPGTVVPHWAGVQGWRRAARGLDWRGWPGGPAESPRASEPRALHVGDMAPSTPEPVGGSHAHRGCASLQGAGGAGLGKGDILPPGGPWGRGSSGAPVGPRDGAGSAGGAEHRGSSRDCGGGSLRLARVLRGGGSSRGSPEL